MFSFIYMGIVVFLTFLLIIERKLILSLSGVIYSYFAFMSIIHTLVVDNVSIFSVYFMVMFAIPSLILSYFYNHNRKLINTATLTGRAILSDSLSYVKFILFVSILTGVSANIYLINYAHSFSDSVITGLEYSRFYSDARYSAGEGIPLIVRLLNAITHAGAIITIFFFLEKLIIKRKFSFLFLVPALSLVLESVLLGTKGIIILVVIYFISGYIVIASFHGIRKISARITISVLSFMSVLFVMMVVVHYIRAQGNLSPSEIIIKMVTSYFIIPFFALVEWSENVNILPHYMGGKILEGITHYFLGKHETGEFFSIVINNSYYQTNVYTLYRQIMQDFGLILAPLFFSALMSLYYVTQKNLQKGKVFFIPVSLFISNFILFSFAASIYTFTTNIIAISFVFVYFYSQKNKRLTSFFR